MAGLPAICEQCGKAFIADNLIGGSGRIHLKNVGVGPCPYCEGFGLVPDGAYELSDAVRIARKLSDAEVAALRLIHEQITKGEISEDEAREKIKSKVPSIAPLLTPEAGVLAQWLALLISIIALIVAMRGGSSTTINAPTVVVNEAPTPILAPADQPPTDDTVRRVVEEVRRQETNDSQLLRPNLGRNEPCHCGSGKKYKFCHLER